MLVTMTVFLILMTVIIALFINMYKIKWWLEARQKVTQESYFLLEKLQSMVKDYTIDYEEYWNRTQMGCMEEWSADVFWNADGSCDKFTNYGNWNMLHKDDPDGRWSYHELYYCTSNDDWLNESENDDFGSTIVYDITESTFNMNCIESGSGFSHSYGQYAKMFMDVKDDVDYVPWAANDDDDVDLGDGPEAIYQTDDNKPQELYLISHDKTKRLYMRRVLKDQIDINNDGYYSPSEQLYSLQVLQLRWFDAGEAHDFDATSHPWVYDGVIDTRACDYSKWFFCKWQEIDPTWAYKWYKLPRDNDDGRVDLLWSDITISDWNLSIYPHKDPTLAWNDDVSQQSPYVIISLVTQLYAKNWQRKLTLDQMNTYILPLQTQFSFMIQ